MGLEWITLLGFATASLALNLTPGADMMFCLGQGARSGWRAALAASAGISAGAFVHVTLAALGIATVVATVPLAFDVIRWIGVGYLLYLAFRTLQPSRRTNGQSQRLSVLTAFRAGLFVNLLNPKVILFVLAFLPQFVDPSHPILPQFLILGAILSMGGFAINGAVGVLAGGLGRKLAAGNRWLDWFAASVFAALAAKLAVLERT